MSKRDAADLLWEWIANDHPVYRAGRDLVKRNRSVRLDYGAALRDLILDIRSAGPVRLSSGRAANRVYVDLCREMRKMPEYRSGYPINDGAQTWTMDHITDREFGAVDWTKLADELFSESYEEWEKEA